MQPNPSDLRMPRRRGRAIGTLIIGACVVVAFGYALSNYSERSPTLPFRAMKAEVGAAERALAPGASVRAVDGTSVGTVSGISRGLQGQVERLRVTTVAPDSRVVLVRRPVFTIDERGVRLNLSVAEVSALPRVMMEDHSAGRMSFY